MADRRGRLRLLNQRREFEKWAQEKRLSKEQREMVLMICDFKRANPDLTVEQLLRSQWLDYTGGISRIRSLFGNIQNYWKLGQEAMDLLIGRPLEKREVKTSEPLTRLQPVRRRAVGNRQRLPR